MGRFLLKDHAFLGAQSLSTFALPPLIISLALGFNFHLSDALALLVDVDAIGATRNFIKPLAVGLRSEGLACQVRVVGGVLEVLLV